MQVNQQQSFHVKDEVAQCVLHELVSFTLSVQDIPMCASLRQVICYESDLFRPTYQSIADI